MSKEDYTKLNELSININIIDTKLKSAVFIKQYPTSKLIPGNEFNSKLKSVIKLTESIIFTKTPIPVNKISESVPISTSDSEVKSYAYNINNVLYISPEEEDTIIYANENCFNMFYECSSLTLLDLSNFNTSKVTSMNFMFNYCTSLKSLNLSKFDTSNVISMSGMFNACLKITSLDVSNFNTSKVTDMGSMFYKCSSLDSLDLSNFDTSKVEYMNGMFYDCMNLYTLKISKWDTSNVIDMSNMFYYCDSLTYLDLSGWNTSKVTNTNKMFYYCSKLSGAITIRNIKHSSYIDMFFGCSTNISQTGLGFLVYYVAECQSIATAMIATKSSNSTVILGGKA